MPKHTLRVVFYLLILSFAASHCTFLRDLASGPTRPTRPADEQFRFDVVRYASQFIGAPYKHAGTNPQSGFDCSGFTSYVLGQFDIRLSRSSREQEKQGARINVGEVKPGDLIFFRRSRGGEVFHVSLVTSNTREGITVIHSVSRGVVEENISKSSYWQPMIMTARDVVSRPF
jgi:cell wall-associated NlpC family hydrolase